MYDWNDEADAERFVRTYADLILRLCLSHGLSRADAQDICQEMCIRDRRMTWNALQELPPVFIYEPEFVEAVEDTGGTRDWTVEKVEDYYVVSGAWVDKIMGSVNVDDYESRQYMDRMLKSAGVYEKLAEMAVQEGDFVVIGDLEFEYVY